MHEERLLERIRSVEREPLRRGGDNQRRCIESVLSHLKRILNTRQGNVPIAADYGIPDFLDFLQTYPESVHAIEQNIKNAIDKYEPRLSGATVIYLPDEAETLTLRFQITAFITEEKGRKISFETVVDTEGRIHVHR
jgi:type VI secretion system protein